LVRVLYRRLLCPLRLLGGSLRCLLIQIRHSNPPLYGMVIQPSQTLQNHLEMGDPCREQNVSFPRPAEANQLLFQFSDPPGEETALGSCRVSYRLQLGRGFRRSGRPKIKLRE
jgi:hypothetical protein